MNILNLPVVILFKRILNAISYKNKLRTAALFVAMVLQSFFELLFILSLSYMAAALTNPQQLSNELVFKAFYLFSPRLQEWAQEPRYLLLICGAFVILVSIVKNGTSYLVAQNIAQLSEKIAIGIGEEIFSRYLYGNYSWHLSQESAPTFQCMMWRKHVSFLLVHQLSMYACIVTLCVLFISLIGQEPILTSIVLLAPSIVGILLYRGIRRHVDRHALAATASELAETQAVLCATRGIRDVLIYRQQKTFLNELLTAAEYGVPSRVFNSIAPTLPTWVLEVTGFIVVFLTLIYLVFVEHADIPRIAAALTLLLLAAWRILPYANRIVSLQVAIRGLFPTVKAVLDLLEAMRRQPTQPLPEPSPDFTLQKSIALKDISFRYPDADRVCLHELSFEIPIGKKIGIIGPSGAGKSTLVSLLSGLLLPTSGVMSVDGLPLTPERMAAFAMRIGYVPQHPFLFAGTLAENVAFSRWKMTWDEKEVLLACRKASIDFLDTHPLGVHQPIGENGTGLSGGQAQRVSIARALYAHPQLLIFDEATSALDQSNEDSIQHTIDNLSENITCIIVAHRLTTVESCDIIIWMDNGRVVMQGNAHDVLHRYSLRCESE